MKFKFGDKVITKYTCRKGFIVECDVDIEGFYMVRFEDGSSDTIPCHELKLIEEEPKEVKFTCAGTISVDTDNIMKIEEKNVELSVCKSNNAQLRVVVKAQEKEIQELREMVENQAVKLDQLGYNPLK